MDNNHSIYVQEQAPKEKVLSEIFKINSYLEKCNWMDFDYGNINEREIVLYGCLDQSWRENSIEIVFEFPQLISTMFNWSMGTQKPFIQLISQEQLLKKTNFIVEKGGYIFMLNDDDNGPKTFIVASNIKCNIIKP